MRCKVNIKFNKKKTNDLQYFQLVFDEKEYRLLCSINHIDQYTDSLQIYPDVLHLIENDIFDQ